MQDKDMDQLFRAKLDNYEIEPSAKVWANISSELNQPAQRKSYVPLLRIAASVLVLVSAVLFFLPKKQEVTNPPKNTKLVQNPINNPVTGAPQSINQPVTNPATQVTAVVKAQPKQQIAAVTHQTPVQQPATTVTKPEVDVASQTNPVNNSQQLIADAGTKTTTTGHAMPDGPIKLIPTEDTQFTKPANAIAASNIPDAGNDEQQTPVKKHKVHGLGGFLNKVIAAVDKRDDKIIEFTDTDEGDSITGINLGILKVKKVK